MQYRDNLPDEVCKKLESIERRQKKIIKEIDELGYTVYVNPGEITIMAGSTHCNREIKALYQNRVWGIPLINGWDMGDW